jgi:hypothetical protein
MSHVYRQHKVLLQKPEKDGRGTSFKLYHYPHCLRTSPWLFVLTGGYGPLNYIPCNAIVRQSNHCIPTKRDGQFQLAKDKRP